MKLLFVVLLGCLIVGSSYQTPPTVTREQVICFWKFMLENPMDTQVVTVNTLCGEEVAGDVCNHQACLNAMEVIVKGQCGYSLIAGKLYDTLGVSGYSCWVHAWDFATL